MNKKITIKVNGRKVRIMEHMLDDMLLFGAIKMKHTPKETPKELLKVVEVLKVELPPMEKTKVVTQTPDPLPEMEKVNIGNVDDLKPKRKIPVRSKSKK